MGFDKNSNEGRSHLEDTKHVGMNVEIVNDNCPVAENMHEKSELCYTDDFIITNGMLMKRNFEDVDKSLKQTATYMQYPEYCTEHEDLFLHEDEKLVKPGDKFASHDEFVKYLNENAKRWYFYYKCSDSHNRNTDDESYTYNCVYLRNKDKYKTKGIRKRSNGVKTECPCKIKLKHMENEKELTVVYVCNHHDHELSEQDFYKLQHGRRLPPHIKEEIMDFLALRLDLRKIRAYVKRETGLSMSRAYFYTLERNMKIKNVTRYLTEERLQSLWDKINSIQIDDDNTDDQADQSITSQGNDTNMPKASKLRATRNSGLEDAEMVLLPKRRTKNNDENKSASKRSKLEDNLQLSYGNETLMSVKHLQESVKCETQKNPWISDQCVPVLGSSKTGNTGTEQPIQINIIKNDLANLSNEPENISYTIEYYNPDGLQAVNNELCQDTTESANEGTNSNEYIAYETVVNGNDFEIQYEADKNASTSNEAGEHLEETLQDNADGNETFNVIESGNQIQYVTEDGENIVQYIESEEPSGHNVGVQTSSEDTNTLMPVFDVYMKDGNVTGFVVNTETGESKDPGVDKEVQTNKELGNNSQPSQLDSTEEMYETEIIYEKTGENTDTYTKHEYVHRHNIDKYMTQPYFPRYIKIFAKETNADVLRMFKNIYRERAMFKMTTTQRGKEGNTRIWYIKEAPRFKRPANSVNHEIEALKEKIRELEKENDDLVSRNQYLGDVALKLLDGESLVN